MNRDIDYRHFYLEGTLNREESSDQLNQRYLRGAMKNRLPRDSELCDGSRNYSAGCRFHCSLHVAGGPPFGESISKTNAGAPPFASLQKVSAGSFHQAAGFSRVKT